MSDATKPVCCPRFDPAPWEEKTFTWENKLFVKDRVRSFLHIPLNFKGVMMRNMAKIEEASAAPPPEEMMVLSDENSLWGADVYITVTKNVPGAQMATLSGTYLAKVFEGPYSGVPKWMKAMKSFVAEKGKELQKLFCFYSTCPKCAKEYGKNYVVMLAQV